MWNEISALESSEIFDVCVVGSGFAGMIVGKSLVERGVRTVVLESGSSLLRWFTDRRIRQLAAYEFSGNTNYPLARTRARAVGGTSNFWTGRCERFHPSDFEPNPYTPSANPWPIRYADVEPYYQRAEKTLRVRGGMLSKYAPPRSNGATLPGNSVNPNLKSLVAKAGVAVDSSPTATPRRGFRFFRVHKEIRPAFLASPEGLLVPGMTITKLVADRDRRIIGAEARTLSGKTHIVRAKKYVLACGGIETPRLLLLSRSDLFPKGIGNAHDLVGRHFNEHPGVNFYARIPANGNGFDLRHKIGRSHQFYDEFRSEGLGSVLLVFIQSLVFPNHLMTPKLSAIPKTLVTLPSRVTSPMLYIGATIEMRPSAANRVTLAEHSKDCFGNPLAHLSFNYTESDLRTLERARKLIRDIHDKLGAKDVSEGEVTWSRHHLSTCQMGDNPRTSVVDRNLRVHECPNVYLCGSEVFVTGAAAPPVLTITALAHRLSDHLITSLREG
jgi:glucose dehydrogenase